jgi:hypothetical protein
VQPLLDRTALTFHPADAVTSVRRLLRVLLGRMRVGSERA